MFFTYRWLVPQLYDYLDVSLLIKTHSRSVACDPGRQSCHSRSAESVFGEEINPFSTIRLSLFVLAAATTVLARQNRELRPVHDFLQQRETGPCIGMWVAEMATATIKSAKILIGISSAGESQTPAYIQQQPLDFSITASTERRLFSLFRSPDACAAGIRRFGLTAT